MRYSINPLGLLYTCRGFHDCALMNNIFFYCHDAAHAVDALGHADAPEEKQQILDKLSAFLGVEGCSRIQEEAVFLLLFELHHEVGKCLLAFVNCRKHHCNAWPMTLKKASMKFLRQ